MDGLFTHLEFELPVRTSLWKQPADNLTYDFGVQEKGLAGVANVEEVIEPREVMQSPGRMHTMRQMGSQVRIRGVAIPKRQAEEEDPAEETMMG